MTVFTMSVFCIGYIQQSPKLLSYDSLRDVSILYRIHPAILKDSLMTVFTMSVFCIGYIQQS